MAKIWDPSSRKEWSTRAKVYLEEPISFAFSFSEMGLGRPKRNLSKLLDLLCGVFLGVDSCNVLELF